MSTLHAALRRRLSCIKSFTWYTWLARTRTHYFSASLSVSIASTSGNGVDLSPRPSVGLSVFRSVGLSLWKVYCGKTAESIWMPFTVVSGVDQGMGVLDGMVIVKGEGAVLGVNLGHPTGDFVAQLCESNMLFPNYFGEDLLTVRTFCFDLSLSVFRIFQDTDRLL